jgi:hypothetical protein
MTPITYTSDQPDDYAKAVDGATTLADLVAVLAAWKPIAPDATLAVPKDDTEFKAFRKGLRAERRGLFSGNVWVERFGAILMPDLMMRVSMVANKFQAPWGLVFIRLRDHGALSQGDDGIYQMHTTA